MSVSSRFGVVVNQRYAHVGEQYGKGDTIREAAPTTDQKHHGTDEETVNQAAFIRRAGTDRIGRDKNAPSMVAPESRWIMGDAVVPGAKVVPVTL